MKGEKAPQNRERPDERQCKLLPRVASLDYPKPVREFRFKFRSKSSQPSALCISFYFFDCRRSFFSRRRAARKLKTGIFNGHPTAMDGAHHSAVFFSASMPMILLISGAVHTRTHCRSTRSPEAKHHKRVTLSFQEAGFSLPTRAACETADPGRTFQGKTVKINIDRANEAFC